MMFFTKLIKNFGKINSIVLFICIILLLLEFVGHRHGEFKIEDFLDDRQVAQVQKRD